MAGGSLLLPVGNKVVLELLIRLPPLLECEITGVITGTANHRAAQKEVRWELSRGGGEMGQTGIVEIWETCVFYFYVF